MEENENVYVALTEEQFTELTTELRQTNENLQVIDKSVVHATTFLIVLVVFQFYGILSRARKKGGV